MIYKVFLFTIATITYIDQESIYFSEGSFYHFAKIDVTFFSIYGREIALWHIIEKNEAFFISYQPIIHVDIITEIQKFNVTAFL